MYRILTGVLVLALAGMTGCAQKKAPSETERVDLNEVAPKGKPGREARQPGDEALGGKVPAGEQSVETVTPDEPATFPQPTATRTHVVQPGETLSQLAREYYGNIRYWRKIWQANRELIPNPNQIKPGMELVIP